MHGFARSCSRSPRPSETDNSSTLEARHWVTLRALQSLRNRTPAVSSQSRESPIGAVRWDHVPLRRASPKLRDARLQVVSVWHAPALVYGGPGFAPSVSTAVDEAFRDVADGSAEAAAETAREAGVDVEVDVEQGETVDKLLEAAADADVLVVGSRGHGGFTGLMLGSVSAHCAHHAPCPLVIVR
jgi:nucleotide-binding universal stress UspA family protein